MLQQFGILVHLYRFSRARNVEDFFAGRGVPEQCRYTLLQGHAGGTDDDPQIVFDVVEQKDGNPDAVEGWEFSAFVVSKDSGAGREPLARAFLKSGYQGYVGATERYADGDSAILFAIGFSYHVLAEDRDYAPRAFTDKEAA